MEGAKQISDPNGICFCIQIDTRWEINIKTSYFFLTSGTQSDSGRGFPEWQCLVLCVISVIRCVGEGDSITAHAFPHLTYDNKVIQVTFAVLFHHLRERRCFNHWAHLQHSAAWRKKGRRKQDRQTCNTRLHWNEGMKGLSWPEKNFKIQLQ